jgi:hypothetical protein
MLQRLNSDDWTDNEGGLFLVVDHIVAMVPVSIDKTQVCMISGDKWIVPWGVAELIEELRDVGPLVPSRKGALL